MLKFFPGISPAEDLAMETIQVLTFGLIPNEVSIIMLAIWEVLLGLLFFTNLFQKVAIPLALVHMACTFLPLVFFPTLSFTRAPYAFTLVGQYIVKNLVFIVALLMMHLSREKPS
ncbi:MAG: doxx family protein [Saprospirales bacterium]|nr:doxx family protein [Saprospirales bacterium]